MKNNRWWLTQRMTRWGIITCPEPLETGWDDTPRLDHGPILALDMNSYLLLQMRCCAELAKRIGDTVTQAQTQAMVHTHAARMVERLYDEKDNLFKDVLVATGEKLPIKTPACFLPLLAGVPIEESKARRMIENSLLNPNHFFGSVPFPCVAYDEPTYHAQKWWRGPTWMPVAYLMLEVLRQVRLHRPGLPGRPPALPGDDRRRQPARTVQQRHRRGARRPPAGLDRRHLPATENGTRGPDGDPRLTGPPVAHSQKQRSPARSRAGLLLYRAGVHFQTIRLRRLASDQAPASNTTSVAGSGVSRMSQVIDSSN